MLILKRLWLSIFLGKRFYRTMAAVIFLFLLSYFIPFLFNIALLFLGLFSFVLILDFLVLFSKRNPVSAKRILPERLSNGDENIIHWQITNNYPFRSELQLIEEFPEAWQIRDFKMKLVLDPDENKVAQYTLRPNKRGEFFFGDLHIFIKSPLQLLQRRKTFTSKESVRVFPAFLLLRQFEFKAHITDPEKSDLNRFGKRGIVLSLNKYANMSAGTTYEV